MTPRYSVGAFADTARMLRRAAAAMDGRTAKRCG